MRFLALSVKSSPRFDKAAGYQLPRFSAYKEQRSFDQRQSGTTENPGSHFIESQFESQTMMSLSHFGAAIMSCLFSGRKASTYDKTM
jgi:hypothetical protein